MGRVRSGMGHFSFGVGIFHGLELNFDMNEMINISVHQQMKEIKKNNIKHGYKES